MAFFGVNFIFQKFCLCKKMTNIRYVHRYLRLVGRTKYKSVWKPWCQRVLLLGLSEGKQWRFANVDSLPGKYVICLVNFFDVFESISMISFNCMCGTIRKATSRTLSLVDLNFSFELISLERVDERSRCQINTAEWFNGVFLSIEQTHDFKKEIWPWTYGQILT